MQIIIPAAGKGQRFTDAGYEIPKPFVDVLGKPMVSRVIENVGLTGDENEYVPIISKEHYDFADKNRIRLGTSHNYDVRVSVIKDSKHSDGISGSAPAILKSLRINEGSALIVNCDQLVEEGAIKRAVDYFQKNNVEAGIISTLSVNKNYSHLSLNDDCSVSSFWEKNYTPDGSLVADVGIIYWKSAIILSECLGEMISEGTMVNGEYCHGPAINNLLRRNVKVLPYMVNEFVNIGIPEELRGYIELHS